MDERSERMNAKIRDAQKQKMPYMLVVGDKEMEKGQVALRLRSGENPGAMDLADFVTRAKADEQAGSLTAEVDDSGRNMVSFHPVFCPLILTGLRFFR